MTVKRRNIYIAIIGMIVLLCAAFTSCASKPSSLEELLNSNADVQQEIQSAAEEAGMTVEVKGNAITYSDDLAGMEGATEEAIKDKVMIDNLQTALDSQGEQFGGMCKKLEEETEITGISATVNYTYGDEVLATKTYTSAD